ncbi:UNVERIFIED_CONTAM: hypothetical protein FKN15_060260 [Acipenser sinensis]
MRIPEEALALALLWVREAKLSGTVSPHRATADPAGQAPGKKITCELHHMKQEPQSRSQRQPPGRTREREPKDAVQEKKEFCGQAGCAANWENVLWQVTNSMFGASRKKFVEGVESDYHDDSMYYSQSSIFPPHRSEKDMLHSPSPSTSGQLSQLGASLYGPQNGVAKSHPSFHAYPRAVLHKVWSTESQCTWCPNEGDEQQQPSVKSQLITRSPVTEPCNPNDRSADHVSPYSTVTKQGHFAHESQEYDEPLPGRAGNRHARTDEQYKQFRVRQSKQKLAQHNMYAKATTLSAALYHKQVRLLNAQAHHCMSGFGMNRNQTFGMNNSLSSNIFNGTDGSENVTGLDLSDFPALADRSRREGSGNPTPLLNPLAGRAPYVGMVTKPASEQSQDFSIHNEDFPALPGSSYKDPTSSNEDSKSNLNSSGKTVSSTDAPKFPGDKGSTVQNNNQQKKGIQVLPDGRVTNIPSGMVTDQFGMIGLLTFIRAAETDPGMVHLALGSDLTTLGLNLNSPENLYPKFASPWASAPCRPQDIDFHVPSEYLTNIHIRDKLAAIKLSRYGEDLLFYLYYMNGGDLLQLLAAVELFNRDWRYHKEERVWITRAPGMEPTMKTNSYERGTYYFFDCLNWRKVAKLFLGSAHHYHPCTDSGGAKMNTRCPPRRVLSAARFFTLCRLTVQPPQSYSVRRTMQLWAAYRQARRRPARLQASLVHGELRTPWPT